MKIKRTAYLICFFMILAGCTTAGMRRSDTAEETSSNTDAEVTNTDASDNSDAEQESPKDTSTEPTDVQANNELPESTDVNGIEDANADVATPPKPLENPFHEGPYGITARKIAAPFVLPTVAGDWDFEKEWTGEDSYFFLQYTKSEQGGFAKALWNSSIWPLLNMSPPNVHIFFLSFDQDAEKDVLAMQEKVNKVIDALPPESQER